MEDDSTLISLTCALEQLSSFNVRVQDCERRVFDLHQILLSDRRRRDGEAFSFFIMERSVLLRDQFDVMEHPSSTSTLWVGDPEEWFIGHLRSSKEHPPWVNCISVLEPLIYTGGKGTVKVRINALFHMAEWNHDVLHLILLRMGVEIPLSPISTIKFLINALLDPFPFPETSVVRERLRLERSLFNFETDKTDETRRSVLRRIIREIEYSNVNDMRRPASHLNFEELYDGDLLYGYLTGRFVGCDYRPPPPSEEDPVWVTHFGLLLREKILEDCSTSHPCRHLSEPSGRLVDTLLDIRNFNGLLGRIRKIGMIPNFDNSIIVEDFIVRIRDGTLIFHNEGGGETHENDGLPEVGDLRNDPQTVEDLLSRFTDRDFFNKYPGYPICFSSDPRRRLVRYLEYLSENHGRRWHLSENRRSRPIEGGEFIISFGSPERGDHHFTIAELLKMTDIRHDETVSLRMVEYYSLTHIDRMREPYTFGPRVKVFNSRELLDLKNLLCLTCELLKSDHSAALSVLRRRIGEHFSSSEYSPIWPALTETDRVFYEHQFIQYISNASLNWIHHSYGKPS